MTFIASSMKYQILSVGKIKSNHCVFCFTFSFTVFFAAISAGIVDIVHVGVGHLQGPSRSVTGRALIHIGITFFYLLLLLPTDPGLTPGPSDHLSITVFVAADFADLSTWYMLGSDTPRAPLGRTPGGRTSAVGSRTSSCSCQLLLVRCRG